VAGLDALLKRLEKLEAALVEATKVPQRTAQAVAPVIDGYIAQQYARGMDPYGAAWRPITEATRRQRRGDKNAPPLTDTSKLRNGSRAIYKPGTNKIALTFGRWQGWVHQYGTARVPQREIYPVGKLPAKWQAAIRVAWRKEADAVLRKAFGK